MSDSVVKIFARQEQMKIMAKNSKDVSAKTANRHALSRALRLVGGAVFVVLLAQGAHSAATTENRAPAAGTGSVQISLSFPQLVVTGGDWEIAKAVLSQPAPAGGAKVTVTNVMPKPGLKADVTIAPLAPASLIVPAGQTEVSFKVITQPASAKKIETIAASYGSASTHVILTVLPNAVALLSMSPHTVNYGASVNGQITLQHPAPQDVHYYKNIAPSGAPAKYADQLRKGGATVTLKSGSSALKVPPSVNVPSGGSSATFIASTSQPSSCSMGSASSASAAVTATWQKAAMASLTIGQESGKPSRYTSKTIGIDPKNILGVSHDAHALVLNGADKCVQSLAAGDVIFFKKLGVLDVKKVMKIPGSAVTQFHVPSGVAVAVSSAALTDFINDGTFQVFKQTLGDAAQPTGPWASGLEPDQPASGDDDWKYKTSGTGTTYSFLAYKQKNGLQASVSGNGQITKFGYNFLAVIHSAKLQQATYKVDTDGTLDIDWMVQTTAPGQGIGESRLRLPPMHAGLVDSADDIPLLFQVYGNLIFKPGFGEKAAAKGHFRVTFSGEGGIDGNSPLNQGLKAQTEISSTTSSAKAAHGAVVAINAPKFALSLSTVSFLYAADARMPNALNDSGAQLADSLQGQLGVYVKGDLKPPTSQELFTVRRAAYVSWVTSVGYAGAGMLAMLPCQQYYQTFLTLAGVDKTMLGSISGSIPPKDGLTVFQDKKTTIIPPIKGCEPKQDQGSN